MKFFQKLKWDTLKHAHLWKVIYIIGHPKRGHHNVISP
jgi:hypothetical protein